MNSYGILTNFVEDSIPLRDGQYLKCDVYVPSGCTTCPTIVIQTPYWKNPYRLWGLPFGIVNDADLDAQDYAWVVVDWRGFFGSLSAWTAFPNRGEDGYDVIDWVANQSFSDGNIGTWGPSALGNIQFQTAREQHPNHTCMVPLVAAPQLKFQSYFPGGSIRTEYVDQLDGLGFGVSPWLMPNHVHNAVWDLAEPPTWYPDSIDIPTLMIGGWYDHNVVEMMEFWDAIRTVSPAKDDHRLLMGPWAHGGSGTAQVGTTNQGEMSYPAATDWNDDFAMAFFDYHLMGAANSWDTTSFVTYFQCGDDVWQSDTVWPPAGTTMWDFQLIENSGALMMDPAPDVFGAPSVTVQYDPTDPSPTHGGPTLRIDQEQGPFDISDTVETRGDVLIFNYYCDQDVTVKGAPVVHLTVSADVVDTDFAVRLCDVEPSGRSIILLDGIQRMRYRNGFEASDTAAIVPGNQYQIDIVLPDIAYTFQTGHTLRLDITGSNYPRFNRNMNTGGPMYPDNNNDTLVNPITSNNTVYTGPSDSYLRLPLKGYVVDVDEIVASDPQLMTFPNPTSDVLNVRFELESSKTIGLVIYDVNLNLVMDLGSTIYPVGHTEQPLDISALSQGAYILCMSDREGIISTTEFHVIR